MYCDFLKFCDVYILEILRFETLGFSDATLSDINLVLCYVLSQCRTVYVFSYWYFCSPRSLQKYKKCQLSQHILFSVVFTPPLPATTAAFGSYPMKPKARELTQHGGPPGWLEESDPMQQGVILYVMDGPCRLPCRTTPLDPVYGRSISTCTKNIIMSYVTQRRHGLVL